jgi:dihydroneopterin aldolase
VNDKERLSDLECDLDFLLSANERLWGEVKWLFEQAEKAIQYKNALENISDILKGQNVTSLVEDLAYVLTDSGIYDKH